MIIINMSERKYKDTLRNYNPPYKEGSWEALASKLPEPTPRKALWWHWGKYAAAVLLLFVFAGTFFWATQSHDISLADDVAKGSSDNTAISPKKNAGNEPLEQEMTGNKENITQTNTTNDIQQTTTKNTNSSNSELAKSTLNTSGKAANTVNANRTGSKESAFQKLEAEQADGVATHRSGNQKGEVAEASPPNQIPPTIPPVTARPLLALVNQQTQINEQPLSQVKPSRPALALERGEKMLSLGTGLAVLNNSDTSETVTSPAITLGYQYAITPKLTLGMDVSYFQYRNDYWVSEYERSTDYWSASLALSANYHFRVRKSWTPYVGASVGRQWYKEQGSGLIGSALANDDLEFQAPGNSNAGDQIIRGRNLREARWVAGLRAGAKFRLHKRWGAQLEASTTGPVAKVSLLYSFF